MYNISIGRVKNTMVGLAEAGAERGTEVSDGGVLPPSPSTPSASLRLLLLPLDEDGEQEVRLHLPSVRRVAAMASTATSRVGGGGGALEQHRDEPDVAITSGSRNGVGNSNSRGR